MTYPTFIKGETECAECKKTIGSDDFSTSYITVRDNYMITKFFQFDDGQDNIFCDSDCLAKYLSAEEIYLEAGELNE